MEKLNEKKEDDKRSLEEIEERNRKKEEDYQALVSQFDKQLTKNQLEGLKRSFESYGEYRDSKTYAKRCEEKIKALVAKEKRRKRNRSLLIFFSILFVIIGSLTAYYIVIPYCTYHSDYQNAISLLEEKKYDEAIRIFTEIDGYYDSNMQIQNALARKYSDAESLLANGQYLEAIEVFTELGDYSDSSERVKSTKYSYADSLFDKGQYLEAIKIFIELEGYSDSNER